ncbi:uncharacterized protein LOC111246484 isoform X4 [Varroa destructor]|uniref:G-protein coupled receptors family 1 profile domain-containing protein n=1 Tax=Varroa destructor TaxID=109461 RepID=A0A7M7JH64_VARDE|nr:uncharacterized protein LOC111246484 isoform X4 [Varroa destructor]
MPMDSCPYWIQVRGVVARFLINVTSISAIFSYVLLVSALCGVVVVAAAAAAADRVDIGGVETTLPNPTTTATEVTVLSPSNGPPSICSPCQCRMSKRGPLMECNALSEPRLIMPNGLARLRRVLQRPENVNISALVIVSLPLETEDLDLAKYFPNLSDLRLMNVSLTNLPDLRGLGHLVELYVYRCSLTKLMPPEALASSAETLLTLSFADNLIGEVTELALDQLYKLENLVLKRNRISTIHERAFETLASLKFLDLSHNFLTAVPNALLPLKQIREILLSDNEISYIGERAFASFGQLNMLELANNPLHSFHHNAFAGAAKLKRLMLKQVINLELFPNLTGSHALEQLRLSRAKIHQLPHNICQLLPKLKILYLMSNNLNTIPNLDGCRELLILDLTYNKIDLIPPGSFSTLENLRDLNLGNNLISEIERDAFIGLRRLQVLAMERNRIRYIHPEAFRPLTTIEDLEPDQDSMLGGGFGLGILPPRTRTRPIEEPVTPDTVLWLKDDFGDEQIDFGTWNRSHEMGYFDANASDKFPEFARTLLKAYGSDYIIPDNLAQYAEEYMEDYRGAPDHHNNNGDSTGSNHKHFITCLPTPTPFMPCEDLFGWWTLRCGVWVVFLLALLGNGLVVVVLSFGRSKIDVPRFLVCNLAMADFLMGIYLGFLAVVDASTLSEFKFYGVAWQTSFGCQLAGFLGVLSSELSVYTLAVITMERNYAITHAMHLNKRLSLKHASYIMSVGWSFAFVMALLPLFGISDYRKFAVCLPFETEDRVSLLYVVFLLAVNGMAFLILMGCYLKMYCAIRGSQAWNSNDSRIAKRMALLVFTDFLCWAPIAFFSLTALSGIHLINLEEAKVFTIFVLPLNSCANPFLYAIFTKQFKRDCVLICKRIEESRVTRGIGRCRHSSNFSNRHTLANTNSAGERKSLSNEQQCQCQCGMIKNIARDHLISSQGGWKKFARRYLLCQEAEPETEHNAYNMALVRIQRNMERGANRTSSISSENFSSRSDSWRQGSIPFKLIDRNGQRKSSWGVTRKASQDSSISCSRQDSSTSTVRITSRSSVSSGEAGTLLRGLHLGNMGPHGHHGGCGGPCSGHGPLRPQPGKSASLDPTLARLYRAPIQGKPQLCRQLAVDDGFRSLASQNTPHSHSHNPGDGMTTTSSHHPTNILNHHQNCTATSSATVARSHSNQGTAGSQGAGRSPPHLRRFKGDQLCSACARKEMGLVGSSGPLAPGSRKDDKFNCFYNRLTETSREDSSEASKDDPPGTSEQSKQNHSESKHTDTSNTLDNTNSNSEDTHGHSIPSTATTGIMSSDGQSVPDSSVPTEGLATDCSVDSNAPLNKDKLSKKDEGRFGGKDKKDKKVKKNRQSQQQAGHHHISVDDINAKAQALQAGQTGAASGSASRKTVSDNSLKKLSFRNLPHFLRQFSSSQSPKNSAQIPQSSAQGQFLGPPSAGLQSSKSDTGIAQRADWGSLEAHTERASSSDSESEPSEIRFMAQGPMTPKLPSIRTITLPPEDEPDAAEHSPLI